MTEFSSHRDAALRPDLPATLEDEDAFGHQDYADAAIGVLLEANAPFTLGLFGDWGLGKSTIIRGIRRGVERSGRGFVLFDAWRYEDDALRREFIREVARQLKQQNLLPRRYNLSVELRDLDVDIPAVEWRLALSVRHLGVSLAAGIAAFVAAYATVRYTVLGHVAGGQSASSSQASTAALILSAGTFVYSVLSQAFRVQERTVTVKRIAEPERFYAKFVELLRSARKAGRVVIAIDNLDRCSPVTVERILGTIKTYLDVAIEQAVSDREQSADAVFVIAADDEAIRRHIGSTRQTSGGRDDREAPEVSEAEIDEIDEFLRKFFNAVIHVRAPLAEDMSRYAEEKLRPILASENGRPKPDEETAKRAIEMVAVALRRNPRRIKQFVTNLDVRLRVITQRESTGRIDPPISHDILGIAKVAIIEEEWRDAYRLLREDPTLLAAWQREAVTGDPVNPALASFLRQTREIIPDNIVATVNLKLEQDDLTLPGFARYREAVTGGEIDVVERLLGSADAETQPLYALRLRDLLARELRARRFQRAREIVDVALREPPVGVSTEETRRVILSDAVAHAPLCALLPGINPRTLFAALDLLGPEERRRARRPFLNLPHHSQVLGGVAVRDISVELASRIAEFDDAERGELRNALGVDPWASQFRADLMPIAAADPTLVTESAASLALSAGQRDGLNFDSAEMQILGYGFQAGVGLAYADEVVQALGKAIREVMFDTEHLDARSARFLNVLGSAADVSYPIVEELAATLEQDLLDLLRQHSRPLTRQLGFVVDVADQLIRLSPPGTNAWISVEKVLAPLTDPGVRGAIEDDLVDRHRALQPATRAALGLPPTPDERSDS